jgi:hypothetical protein
MKCFQQVRALRKSCRWALQGACVKYGKLNCRGYTVYALRAEAGFIRDKAPAAATVLRPKMNIYFRLLISFG